MKLPANRKTVVSPNQVLFESSPDGKFRVSERERLLQLTAINTEELLERYGNQPSESHRQGIFSISNLFAEMLLGNRTGRIAVPMPTGTGKTTAIIGLLKAVDKLNLGFRIAVCCETVEALCKIKRTLIQEGVSETKIALVHSYKDDPDFDRSNPKPNTASEPANEDLSRPILLVTHQKVKRRTLTALNGCDLVIWDEGLLKSKGWSMAYKAIYKAIADWNSEMECSARQVQRDDRSMREYLSSELNRIQSSLKRIFGTGMSTLTGSWSLWEFPRFRFGSDILKKEIQRSGMPDEYKKLLKQIVDESGKQLRAVRTSQGDALVRYDVTIPEELNNVVILDASYPIRTLCHWDEGVAVVDPKFQKDYSAVSVYGWKARSGRTFIDSEFQKGIDNSISAEVVDIIQKQLAQDDNSCFLIFTYKSKSVDVTAKLKLALTTAGLDLEKEIEPGKKQINFLTWGNETSLNDFAHCDNIVLAGILHLPLGEVAAKALGQVEDLRHPLKRSEITSLHLGEQVHMIYQALSRGSCRITENGKAKLMNAWLFHDQLETIQEQLDVVMPGVRFVSYESKHLSKGITKTERTAKEIESILDELLSAHSSQGAISISSKELKSSYSSKYGQVNSKQFQRAGELVTQKRNGWSRVSRSYVYNNRDQI